MAKIFDREDEPNDFMEMPCRCDCGMWFDLNDGYSSEKQKNKVICGECGEAEEKEIEREEEIASWRQDYQSAKDDMEACAKTLKELGVEVEPLSPPVQEDATIEDYNEVLADHDRLVRELDVIINGENAAKQASLCDIVSQCRNIFGRPSPLPDESALKDEAKKYAEEKHGVAGEWKTIELLQQQFLYQISLAYLEGRRKTIEAMDAEIAELKEQLRVKEFFLRKAYDDLNIKNELLTKRDEQIEALKDEAVEIGIKLKQTEEIAQIATEGLREASAKIDSLEEELALYRLEK
jgi:hypothetical protein